MDTIRITNDYIKKASADFWIGEYWKNVDFDLPYALIMAGQILRDYFGIGMTVTNTYPDGMNFGYHRLMKATDWVASDESQRQDTIEKYNNEVVNYIAGNGSELIKKLRLAGITGMGVENVCIHLDTRPEGIDPVYGTSCNREDKYGKYLAFKFVCHYDANGVMIIDTNCAL